MTHRYQTHYTREEARALLPQLRTWLAGLEELRVDLEKNDQRLAGLMSGGQDVGGELVNQSVKLLGKMKGLFQEFETREIIVKDLQRGLVDFPAIVGEREVFLCWEKDEEDVEYWHDIDSGYAGREPL
ncbi:MAG TPA: DUF2203 domain-containing protein [Verrucomicrobiae bacterium]|nr:DUF2203 domain-containing protein [Verrucomicrobiae bacterium]